MFLTPYLESTPNLAAYVRRDNSLQIRISRFNKVGINFQRKCFFLGQRDNNSQFNGTRAMLVNSNIVQNKHFSLTRSRKLQKIEFKQFKHMHSANTNSNWLI